MKKSLFYALVFVLIGCTEVDHSQKPVVAVSISPLGWVVQNIADTLVDIEVVVPDAVGAENYDPTPRQVARLAEADVYFKVGLLDFEKNLSDANSVNLCDEVEIINGRDPHIWLSVLNMRQIAGRVHNELRSHYPDDSITFDMRYAMLDSMLNDMDCRFQEKLSSDKNVLIVHPSLSYLARDYGFTQIAVENDGKEPSAADLKAIYDMVSLIGIKTIYYSIQDNPQEAKAIASEAGIKAVKFDPLSGDWNGELETLVANICGN